MENKNQQKKLSSFFKSEITKVPKEALSDSMAIIKTHQKILFRPNNYRRQITVKKRTNSTEKNIKVLLGAIPSKRNKLIFIKEYQPNIIIQYGKNTVTAIYSQNMIGGHKETYLFEGSINHIQERIDNKTNEIRKKADKALRSFCRKFKIGIPTEKPTWSRYEDWIKGDDYIDNIPDEVIIHDTVFKKVYGKGIEFKNTGKGEAAGVHAKNYIKNRAIEDISPQIASSINHFNNNTALLLGQFSDQIKLHLSVLKGIDKSFKTFNKKLEERKLKEWF